MDRRRITTGQRSLRSADWATVSSKGFTANPAGNTPRRRACRPPQSSLRPPRVPSGTTRAASLLPEAGRPPDWAAAVDAPATACATTMAPSGARRVGCTRFLHRGEMVIVAIGCCCTAPHFGGSRYSADSGRRFLVVTRISADSGSPLSPFHNEHSPRSRCLPALLQGMVAGGA